MVLSFLYSTRMYGDSAYKKIVRYFMTFPFTVFLVKLTETLETLQKIQ